MQYQKYQRKQPQTFEAVQFTDMEPSTLEKIQKFTMSGNGMTMDFSDSTNPKIRFKTTDKVLELNGYVTMFGGLKVYTNSEFEYSFVPLMEKKSVFQYARYSVDFNLTGFLKDLLEKKFICSYEFDCGKCHFTGVESIKVFIPLVGVQNVYWGDYVFQIGDYVGVCNSRQFEKIKTFAES